MRNLKTSIRWKILFGFLFLLLLFLVNGVLSFTSISKSNGIVKEIDASKDPAVDLLNEFKLMVVEGRMFSTNWVYMRKNEKDKAALKVLQQERYPALQDQLAQLAQSWDSTAKVETDTFFHLMDTLIRLEQGIMQELSSFEAYDDAFIKWGATDSLELKILPLSEVLLIKLDQSIEQREQEKAQAREELFASFSTITYTVLTTGVVILVLGLLISILTARSIIRPLNKIKNVVEELSKGQQPEQVDIHTHDEIGAMSRSVSRLAEGLQSTSVFASNIGQGKFDADFQPMGENDVLGNALLEMRQNLRIVAEEDKARNWANEGYALFGDLLRKHNHSPAALTKKVTNQLVKYLGANQGSMFLLNDDVADDHFLELKATYAWNREKFLKKKVGKGDGLVGQCWIEKEPIFLTDVPDAYISISSGLGHSNPRCILIVPMIFNEEVFGILELALFKVLEPHEIEFVKRLAENVASALSSAKTNYRTKRLLEESQEKSEQLRDQEEEMRQNMEELQATQEELMVQVNRQQSYSTPPVLTVDS